MSKSRKDIDRELKNIIIIWLKNISTNQGNKGVLSTVLKQHNNQKILLSHQQNTQYFLNKILKALIPIQNFSCLSRQLGSNSGFDDQLMASFYFQEIFGLEQIEIDEHGSHWDFSFCSSGNKYYIEVKSLYCNYDNYVRKLLTIAENIRCVVCKITNGKQIFPELSNFDLEHTELLLGYTVQYWQSVLFKHNFREPYVGETFTVNFRFPNNTDIPVSTKLPPLNTLHYFEKQIENIIINIPKIPNKNHKFIGLFVMPQSIVRKMVHKIDGETTLANKIYEAWKGTELTGVVFLSYAEECFFTPQGFRFRVYEQHKNGDHFLFSENNYFIPCFPSLLFI